jgi:branched-chain amino acid aminotransferase
VFVHLNGRIVDEAEALVPVTDRGFLYGDGIFETMRAAHGVIFRFARHARRLRASAERIGLERPVDEAALRAECDALLRVNGLRDARLRVTVTRGPGRPGDYVGAPGPATRVITAAPFAPVDPVLAEAGVAVVLASRRQPPADVIDPSVKSTSRLHLVLARREAAARGAFEAILLDGGGRLAEGTASNLFLVRRGALLTPPAPGTGLPGVTREAVFDLAREAGIGVSEEDLPVALLFEADEAFLTNTTWEVLPVTRADGRAIGGGRPGPVAALLRARYRALVEAECR